MTIVVAVLAFALAVLISVLFSKAIRHTALSASVIFLITGFLLGRGVLQLIQIKTSAHAVTNFVQIALFRVLFADGMKIGARDLAKAWKLPSRALLSGLSLTLILIAMLAHLVVGLGRLESFLVGAVLSPTDPVFASAFVSHPVVSRRLRQLLNVGSGLNDGLALPIVLLILPLNQVRVHDDRKEDNQDLLNFAARYTFQNDGAVYVVEASKMPDQLPVAAVFRY